MIPAMLDHTEVQGPEHFLQGLQPQACCDFVMHILLSTC